MRGYQKESGKQTQTIFCGATIKRSIIVNLKLGVRKKVEQLLFDFNIENLCTGYEDYDHYALRQSKIKFWIDNNR